jgi:hypothetical protein
MQVELAHANRVATVGNQSFDHHSDHPQVRQPSAASRLSCGKVGKAQNSPQLGSHPGESRLMRRR